ncbi:hypothetical protein [Methanobrevibacter curvatus]|uniref:Uncharacterized protein n=1 Tax=Methanobrevibacter curvatus TaxID=49547 RepID=A0A166CAM2_9EURY|nr:hypothetical protein [Methanobrevibacter curvatus]KZX14304.1 hypothetical protein MBCUR_05280 [Methanobrevibacter curvatus]
MEITLKIDKNDLPLVKLAKSWGSGCHVGLTKSWQNKTVQVSMVKSCIDENTYLIEESLIKEVKKANNIGNLHVLVPKHWLGEEILIIQI